MTERKHIAMVVVASPRDVRARYNPQTGCLWVCPGHDDVLRGLDLAGARVVWTPKWWDGATTEEVAEFCTRLAIGFVLSPMNSVTRAELGEQLMLAALDIYGWEDFPND